MCKKFNSHHDFRADQDRVKNCYQTEWISCSILQVAQNAIMRFQLQYPHQVDKKKVVMSEILFLDSTTLETYRAYSYAMVNAGKSALKNIRIRAIKTQNTHTCTHDCVIETFFKCALLAGLNSKQSPNRTSQNICS